MIQEPIKKTHDLLIVGAGFAGMYMLYKAREIGLSALVIERAPEVGGTWYWNCYPGARCDIESLQYSYSFSPALEQDWEWTERFAAQPEILSYARHVADRFDLRKDILFDTRIASARFDADANLWTLESDRGNRFSARFFVMATGPLSNANLPDIPGRDTFGGLVLQSSSWPQGGVDFRGQRVAVIGTGSTGIQIIPQVAAQADHLYVLQRTANFSLPARNRPLDPAEVADWKRAYREKRALALTTRTGSIYRVGTGAALDTPPEKRFREYETRWAQGGAGLTSAYTDLLRDEAANDTAAEFVRGKIRQAVADPQTAEALTPRGYPIGAKRICLDTNYFETFNRANVTLVDLKSQPLSIEPAGFRVGDTLHEVDAIIYATGFDALTGALNAIRIEGVDGVRLKDKWADGPQTYLGLMTAGFPNLFITVGPGSPSVLSNVLVSIEHHVNWIADCLAAMRRDGYARIEPTPEAEARWTAHVDEVSRETLLNRAASWYMGANIPGKPRRFLPYAGGLAVYHRTCAEVAARGYEGFVRTRAGIAEGAAMQIGAA